MKKINANITKLIFYFKTLAFFPASLFCLFPLLSQAAVITVPDDLPTIQGAIDSAVHGDEIVVCQGIYVENINFLGKNIILRSTDPASTTVVASTIIDGSSSGSVVSFAGTECTTCTLAGFTITHGRSDTGGGINGNATLATIQYNNISGNATSKYGGGLYGCGGTIQENIICENGTSSADIYGGGLYGCGGTIQRNTISANGAFLGGGLYGCGGTIQQNTVSGNLAWFGGGLYSCGGAIQGNTISGNSADYFGGGLYGCGGTIQRNTISGNGARIYGGGLAHCDGTIQENTISGNSSPNRGGGLYGCGGTIQGNTIWGNSSDLGGGGLCDCDGTIQQNIISQNHAGGYGEGGGGLYGCDGTIQQNTISGNWGHYTGGGLYACGGTILNNTISQNMVIYFGGGLCLCDGTIQRNIISGNSSYYSNGGGLYQCSYIIENNVIYSNHAADNGGGLYNCDGVIQNNTILDNSADKRGGGLVYCDGIIRNCIIWENTAPSGPQLHLDSCSTPTYSCIEDWTSGGTGNISDDPQLVDPANGDFHLLPNSPCIDAGGTVTLAQDFEGDPRPWDAISEPRGDGFDFDIGADEYTTKTTLAVFSGHDSPVPPVGINAITTGTLVNAYMTDPVVAESGTQYLCTGWLGEGAVPASGITTSFTFVLDQPSTITWLWQTQGYYLSATANPPQGGIVALLDGVTPAIGWYSVGEVVDVLAVPRPDYQFDHWSGDVSGSDNPESITMRSPQSITAHFSPIPTPTPTPTVTPTPTATPSPTPIVPIYLGEYTFDSTTEGWSFLAISGPDFSPASSSYTAGRLGISSPNDSTSRVGIWNGPVNIPYVPDNVYRATFTVCSSMGSFAQDPQCRMRWNQEQSLESASHIVNACGSLSNSLPLDPSTREYSSYFMPTVSGNLGVAFDLLDFEVGRFGTHYVDSITAERFPRPSTGTIVKTYSNAEDFANWAFITNLPPYDPVTSECGGTGKPCITSGVDDYANFGFWMCSATANELTYERDKLYRATFTLQCDSELARYIMPQVRLRCQNEDSQMTQTVELNSQLIGPGAMPEITGTSYDVYWETPILPGTPTTAEDGFIVAMDMLDFDPRKGGTICLDSVTVDYLAIP